MRNYKHVIFDFDGVISDSASMAMVKFNEIRNEHFPSLPILSQISDFDLVYAGPLKSSLDKWITADGTKKFFHLHSAAMQSSAEEVSPFAKIVDTIMSLGSGNFSIVTSAYSEAVERILQKDSIFDASFVYRIAGRELHQSKTEKIKNILADLGIKCREAIYVGDLESDILYCKDVPIDIISVGYGYQSFEYLKSKGPTYMAETVDDLKVLLDTLTN